MTNMLQHMDAYYLRRILNRLVNKEMDQMLCERNSECEGIGNCQVFDKASEDHNVANFCNKKESDWTDEKQGLEQYQMEPSELHALHKIVSVVHDTINVPGQCKSIQSSYGEQDVNSRDEYMFKEPSAFEDDPIAFIFWTLKPLALQKVFLAMVHNFPRTLEALILHMLSPLAAEVLTRKFDKMDQQTTKTQQSEFYKMFYSVFDEPSAAMNSILNGKESFAFLAFRNVLDQYLGTIVSGQQ